VTGLLSGISPNVMPLSRYQKRESSVKTRGRLKQRVRSGSHAGA
jgi:hypothetical protein